MKTSAKLAMGTFCVALAPVLLLPSTLGAVLSTDGASGDGSGVIACSPTGTVAGYGPDQMAHAATIVAVGKQLQVPEYGWVIAIATAITESGLRSLTYGDRDSLGLFQQRPSMGWGTPKEILDPAYAARKFYQHLLALPHWQQMDLAPAAQAVQRSGFPDRYADYEQAARQIVTALTEVSCTPARNGGWVPPTTGRCTSGFGPRGAEFHRGQDIAAPIGTPIVAANSGRVIASGPATGYGLWVRIEHDGGTITTYGHNHRNLVAVGDTVQAGQPIAEVGNRGQSTGPHLHFQIEPGGQPTDPVTFYHQHASTLCTP
ncbi:peptidase M23 [Prauserella marina]|uniref:Peptidase family M23 n=1 Tax=Prauserella marina TaxID=530584 RepID=A0A222VRM8_9PSEU|nr:M23 family metallopeptidase [Prauserella marina]ASR36596.1 peptidase M23 [Prauserella marina]PWV74005.1 peptidase M23-like protein [Prauserella marina]SDD60735.1 Peptidase family M23 [Prauserella marina]